MSESLYMNEPFLKKIIARYTRRPESLNVKRVVEYFQNKKNVRNGKPISDGSKVSQISTFKKVLMKIKDTPRLKELKMPLVMMNQVNQVREEHRNIRNAKTITLKSRDVKKILTGLKSKEFNKLYPALLLASGRKPTDLYTMVVQQGDERNSIHVKSLIKRRSNGCEIEYSVPLLSTFVAFTKAIKNFRALFPELSEMNAGQIARKFSKMNANAMLELSGDLKQKLTSADMRIIYVNRLYERSDKSVNYKNWVQEFLNNDTIDTVLNYSKIHIE